MASYHLAVKTVKRSAGRSATAAAAYRAGCEIACEREGRVHDYARKQGVAESFILAPEHSPDWAQDRAALWNAAEAKETRKNSVTAREWELALPAELSPEERSEIARDFAQSLVDRYGVVADVAIHLPHRDGDDRNHHAHILTTTRVMGPEGLAEKTRVLDAAQTGGPEIEAMRAHWAGLQNDALELAGELDRVDHRSLEAQREAALERGDMLAADELDRDPEIKLGPAVNAIERRAMREAKEHGHDYEPVTDRGREVYAVRQARAFFAEMRARLEHAREVYEQEREEGHSRISAGLSALRAAVDRDRLGQGRSEDDIRDRLARIVARDADRDHTRDMARDQGRADSTEIEDTGTTSDPINERLRALLERDAERDAERDVGQSDPEAHDVHEKYARVDRERSAKDRDRTRDRDDDGWGL